MHSARGTPAGGPTKKNNNNGGTSMFRLFYIHLFIQKCVAVGVCVIFTAGSLPGIAIACEGAGEEPTATEELEGTKGELCENMVLGNKCVETFVAGTDKVEIEEGKIVEEEGKKGRYEKSQEGCTKGLKLRHGEKGKEVCTDVAKVIVATTGKDNYCWLYKNEVTGIGKLKVCDSMSIK
jgi:hypothetical protein